VIVPRQRALHLLAAAVERVAADAQLAGGVGHVGPLTADHEPAVGQLTLGVVPGSQGTFSLEDADGHHFVAHVCLWIDDEWQVLDALEAAMMKPT
jgi:hypothetical protein